ncbi:MAG: AMP-binding protein [Gammaproteobacteria bacterium]|nr:AMP-binding protein [Gammaproteobacteria bacterium]
MTSEPRSLWESAGAAAAHGRLHGRAGAVPVASLVTRSALGAPALAALRDRSVLLLARGQLSAALALLELDGVARRLVLATPDLAAAHLPQVLRSGEIQALVIDPETPAEFASGLPAFSVGAEPHAPAPARACERASEWVLLTSGTSGAPKLVLHTFASLRHAFAGDVPATDARRWSTFYDIRRYGGLQIFLRAVQSGGLVLSDPQESLEDFLARAAREGVTHLSGTPSHWRKALMSGQAGRIAPQYVRLSGELADQGILDALASTYPAALVAHAFASTEAGVAFEVRDGRAGFPARLLEGESSGVELRVSEETLRIRSPGTALRYLGPEAEPLRGRDGFVDTGDRVEIRDGRGYFLGRRSGVINVGGLKVHPEEVEAVLNADPRVRMSLVRARRSPITGAVVTAEVVLREPPGEEPARLARELTERCRAVLAPHKVPTTIKIVPGLALAPSGKLVRSGA